MPACPEQGLITCCICLPSTCLALIVNLPPPPPSPSGPASSLPSVPISLCLPLTISPCHPPSPPLPLTCLPSAGWQEWAGGAPAERSAKAAVWAGLCAAAICVGTAAATCIPTRLGGQVEGLEAGGGRAGLRLQSSRWGRGAGGLHSAPAATTTPGTGSGNCKSLLLPAISACTHTHLTRPAHD